MGYLCLMWVAWLLWLGCLPPILVDTSIKTRQLGTDTGDTGLEKMETGETGVPADQDGDGDGWTTEAGDCNDDNAQVNPGALEYCNNQDDDCNGQIDDQAVDSLEWYLDLDADGYGEDAVTAWECEQSAGFAAQSGDCDDGNAEINPAAEEVCDEQDNDCDGSLDEEVQNTYYADRDGDAFGDSSLADEACTAPTGYVTDSTDCDDSNSNISPASSELCNGSDDDCDGTVDEDDALDAVVWFADGDGDGYGDVTVFQIQCSADPGYVSDSTDCDDTNAAINPVASEICDEQDNNCDFMVDEDSAVDAATWYIDVDGDGYGDAGNVWVACTQPSGFVTNADDCDDTNSGVNLEVDGVCGTEVVVVIDTGDTGDTGDTADTGLGDTSPLVETGALVETGVSDTGETGDTAPVAETGLSDTSGTGDTGVSCETSTWYADADGDGYGEVRLSQDACTQPSGYVADDSDCQDSDATINPGAEEACDSQDNNCDGTVDEDSAVDASVWYADADGDGYGNVTSTTNSCSQPTGYLASAGDYDDTDSSVHWSPCQESWIRIGYEAYLWVPTYEDSSISLTVSTSVDYLSLVWNDTSAPYGFWVTCTEAAGLGGTILAQSSDEYYASAWNQAEEGVTWHWDYLTDLSQDGTAFYSQGHSGDAMRFTSTP